MIGGFIWFWNSVEDPAEREFAAAVVSGFFAPFSFVVTRTVPALQVFTDNINPAAVTRGRGMRLSKLKLRILCLPLLLVPFVAVYVAPLVRSNSHHSLDPSVWLSFGRAVFVALGIFFISVPFACHHLLRGNHEVREARGIDRDQMVHMAGVGGAAASALAALASTALVGDSIANPYPWAAVTLLAMGFRY